MQIADKIRPYSVMVKWNNKVVGSGVLVKSKDNKCYLFTARHLFKTASDKSFKKVKESHVIKNLNEISINRESFENKIYVDKILYFRDDLDLIVFSLKEEPPISHLPIIKILKNDHQIQDYHFYGYPKGAKNLEEKHTGHPEIGKYIQSNEEENHIFRLSATNNIDGEAVSGYSGSGIFVEEKIEIGNENIENSIVYLVGILIRAKEGLSYYEGLDLSDVIDEINDKANIEVPTIEDALDIKFTQHIETKILNRNKEDVFIQQIEKLNKEEDKSLLKEFLDSSESELTEMTKKLADFYLLGGMLYKDNGHENPAKNYFRLATKFNPNYKRYEKSYKGKNDDIEEIEGIIRESSKNYYHLGIIDFQHKDYVKAKENFLEYLKKDDIDSFEKIETYKYLSKIYLNEKNYIEAETYAIEALDQLDQYEEDNILEKAELCYELFEICEKSKEGCSSIGWIKKGLGYIGENKTDIILPIKRKLETQKILIEKDEYINKITPTLLELVQIYPEKYMEEFVKEYLNSIETENKNYNTIYDKVEDLKGYLEEIKNDTVEDSKNNEKKN